MTMFSAKNMSHYVLAISLVLLASYFGTHVKNAFNSNGDKDEYQLIRKYLLNESPLYGYNRPKIWIHSTYEYNARKWKSFGSRSSTDLNQPYLHITVKSVINHCGNDFNVCLIDDDSFSRLLPEWSIQISQLPEPERSYYREVAMAELLYVYGGMVVPNSFVCVRNLMPLYLEGIQYNTPFVLEKRNQHTHIVNNSTGKKRVMTSDVSFMGAPKRSSAISALISFLKQRKTSGTRSDEFAFFDYVSEWCNEQVSLKTMNLLDGKYVGVKSRQGRPILMEDMLSESDNGLDICPQAAFGVYIPGKEILLRNKYQWFSVMNSEELLQTKLNIVPYMVQSLSSVPVTESPELSPSLGRSVISI